MWSWLVPVAAAVGLVAGAAGRAAVRRYAPEGALPPLSAELATGCLFGLLAASAGASVASGASGAAAVLAALCWLAGCAVPLALIDARTRRLPDALTAAAYAGVLALLVVAAVISAHWADLGRAAAGGAVLAGCLLALALIGPGAVGLGDVKLAASAGTALGWYGWRVLLAGPFAGLLLAACYGLVLLALRRATLRQQIAFGPFLLAGTFAAIIAAAAGVLG
jgi:leader peptidase (prepilin peptidase) / N-methyltransferase